MRGATERLNTLSLRLQALVCETHALQDRWMAAAKDVRTWPDMSLATPSFVSQRVEGILRGAVLPRRLTRVTANRGLLESST